MRVNKYISESGLCSRREADKLMENKRVTINGVVAEIGSIIKDIDIVRVDGIIIKSKPRDIYLAFNKPPGIVSTTDQTIQGNMIDYINYPERIFHIGRLDKASEGLILLTNNGDIVNKILREENNHEKEYLVTVNKKITSVFINKMSSGVEILNTTTKPCKINQLSERVFSIILTQGLNRQIRRMCSACNYRVMKLKRVRIMNIKLGKLAIGTWRYLTNEELTELMNHLN